MSGDRSFSSQAKNKQAADRQITAEQIIREAVEAKAPDYKPPQQMIASKEELLDYQMSKRKEFENFIRRNRHAMSNWLKYAKWESEQKDYERARSVFERALDVNFKDIRVWLRYAEMELLTKEANRARNIYNRAVLILPRIDQFWLKWAWLEETLKNYAGARQVFERWMEWRPQETAWNTYIKFELRYNEFDQVRLVFERYVQCHPQPKTWIRWAKFETKHGFPSRSREVYETALQYLGDQVNETLLIAFAKFEEHLKEFDRARKIYQYALDHVPKHRAQELYKTFVNFEKQHGDKDAIEDVISNKRRFQYEEEIRINQRNYDIWFDYIRLEESNGDKERIREVYERGIANLPPGQEKRFWKRYIFVWINYAFYEELEAKDIERARAVYRACLDLLTKQPFSFAKIWILFSEFEVRQMNLDGARLILGKAIGLYPKPKIFTKYIDMELKLANIDRCRTLYSKWIETAPFNSSAWCRFAELEMSLQEEDRCRRIFELAIDQSAISMDQPELIWKAYIDYEIDQEEYDKVRDLYHRLLQKTQNVKVWISFAEFETMVEENDKARSIYEKAYLALRFTDDKEERVMLADAWKAFELSLGDEEKIATIETKMPEKVKRRRKMVAEDGTASGFEEYFDYIFPDEASAKPNLKILQKAREWKRRKMEELQNPQEEQQQ